MQKLQKQNKSLGAMDNKINSIQKTLNKLSVKAPTKTNKQVKKIIDRITNTKRNQLRISDSGCTTYKTAIISPETAIKSKVPRQMSQPTISAFRHITIPSTVNVLGNASIIVSPFFLADNATALSAVLVNNTPTYDGAVTFGVGHSAQTYSYQVPAGNVSDYRLVSASLHIVPQIALMNSNGKIGGAVVSNPFLPIGSGSPTTTYNNLAVIANLESYKPYAEADICIPESLRLVWTPHDMADFAMYPINQEEEGVPSSTSERENLLVAYIVGAPASAKFNIELFLNYEWTPQTGSVINGMGEFCDELTDPMDILFEIRQFPQLLAHAYVSTNHYHNTNDSRSLSVVSGIENVSLAKGQNPMKKSAMGSGYGKQPFQEFLPY